jgi:hypothetical protein
MTALTCYYSCILLLFLLSATTAEPEVLLSATTAEPEVIVSIQFSGGDDQNEKCPDWAAAGECQSNPVFMLENCATSCGGGAAYVGDGEDAAVGAFRFAEESSNDLPVEKVLEVAQKLQDAYLTGKEDGYTPPKELTHCGKRVCSAGKLWKRAEEMRKADMHDVAGADLIRALFKTGIEVDFKQRCKRSLQWALGSIQRQREREQREAVEEAKLEKRREEERAAMEEAKVGYVWQ